MSDQSIINRWTQSKAAMCSNEGSSMASTRVTSCLKIIVIGAAGVGKTCLARRFVNRTFENVTTTVGTDLLCRNIAIGGNPIMLQIWDTAGQENFRGSLVDRYYRGTKAIIFVYDVTRIETFTCLPKWMEECSYRCEEDNLLRILIGNKCDERSATVVTPEMSQKFARANNMASYRTSAKDPSHAAHIDAIFVSMAYLLTKPAPEATWRWMDPAISSSLPVSKELLTGQPCYLKPRIDKKSSCC